MPPREPLTSSVLSSLVAFAVGGALRVLPAQSQWAMSEAFTSRGGCAAAYDAARGVTLFFGGHDGMLRDDTWQWDGIALTRLSPAQSPPPMRGHAMVYDTVRERVVLFGGNTGPAGSNQVWTWNGTDWSQLGTSGLPTVQGSVAMTYDASRDRVVLVGGSGGGYVQLWEFDGTSWSQPPIVPPNWPIVQDLILFAYDAAAGNCALCRTVTSAGMWRWNGVAWTFQASPSSLNQSGALMLHDPVQQRLLLVGGWNASGTLPTLHAWVPATATWQALASTGPSTQQHAVAYDTMRNRVVLLGGSPPGTPLDSSLWEWDSAGWVRRSYAPPSARDSAGVAIDRSAGRVVLYGGASSGDLGDTWHRQDHWELLLAQPQFPGSTHPGNARGVRLVFDEARGEFLLWRPFASSSPYFWRLAGSQWTPIAATAPPARAGPSVCYDHLRQRVLLYGGNVSAQMRDDMWQWDGIAWTQLFPPLVPQARTDAGMAYDPLRDRVVLVGGQLAGGNAADTWEFDGANWTQFQAGVGPTSLSPQVCWDDARQAVIAVAGATASATTMRTWQWNGAAWSEIAVGSTPSRLSMAIASTAQDVLLVGGRVGSEHPAAMARLATPYLATLDAFGTAGASSAGPLQFAGVGPRPWLGSALPLRVSPLPPISLAGAWLGMSNTSWQGATLPFDLGVIGFPGSSVLVSPDVPLPVLDLGTGTATLTIAIPATPALAGQDVFCQSFVFELASGAVATSNGLTLHLGLR